MPHNKLLTYVIFFILEKLLTHHHVEMTYIHTMRSMIKYKMKCLPHAKFQTVLNKALYVLLPMYMGTLGYY